MKYFIGAVSCLALVIVLFIIYIYSGFYNISAKIPHSKVTIWAVNTLKDNSVKHHAKSDLPIPNIADTALIHTGFTSYKKMCGCHGGPDREPGQGFYPAPPLLSKVADDWTPQELFWIVKNGLKMTGMPAFGGRVDDKTIWTVVAFTKKLPSITKEEYQKLGRGI